MTDIWLQVRKKVADIKGALPQGVVGPNFNDEFGDVFGIVYAFTADGFTPRELRDYVEAIRTEVLTVKNAAKALLIGAQDQKFYLEFDTRKLAGLGVSSDQIIESLREQNAVIPSGVVQTAREKYAVRVSGSFSSVDALKRINLFADGKFFRLADVATVKEGYADPPQPMFRFDGEPAIGLAISMAQGGNALAFGADIAKKMDADHRHLADRDRAAPRRRPAGGGRGVGRPFHQGAVGGDRDRAGGELLEPRPARRRRRRLLDPARAGDRLCLHGFCRDQPAADIAWAR